MSDWIRTDGVEIANAAIEILERILGLEHGEHCRLVGGWDDYPGDCIDSADIEADSPETLELYRAAVRFAAGFFGIRDRDEFEQYLSLFERETGEVKR